MCQDGCCITSCCVLWGIGWWIIASGLLFVVWNKVITTVVASVKPLQIWHAFLVVLFVIVLFGPMCFGGGQRCGEKPCDMNSMHCPADSCR